VIASNELMLWERGIHRARNIDRGDGALGVTHKAVKLLERALEILGFYDTGSLGMTHSCAACAAPP
jgi:hypothetical protein